MAKASPEDLKALFDTQRGYVCYTFLLRWFFASLYIYISFFLSLFGARAREHLFFSDVWERDAMLNFFEKMMID